MAGWGLFGGVCALLLVAGLSFVLGAAAGTGLTVEQFKDIVLPLLDAAGGWVSGIGALAAVCVSLWLADRQRREDVEHLAIRAKIYHESGLGYMLPIHAVSDGRRPVTLTSVAIGSKHSATALTLSSFFHKDCTFPAKLHYGETVSLLCQIELRAELKEFIESSCGGKSDGLKVYIRSTVSNFSCGIEGDLQAFLRGDYWPAVA